jgi:glycerol-3-phosphate acyltransferase PlsY
MMNDFLSGLHWSGWVLISYLLGAIPFAVLVARMRGVDIFRVGSGNPGATNVKRSVGKWAGNMVFLLDFCKGLLAVTIGKAIVTSMHSGMSVWVLEWLPVLCLCAVIIGHSFSVFIRFKGGKSVAVMMGGLTLLMPWVLAIGVVVWLFIFFSTRIVSLASIVMAVSLPGVAMALRLPNSRIHFLFGILLFVLIRHRSNLVRLWKGIEPRFEKASGAHSEGA